MRRSLIWFLFVVFWPVCLCAQYAPRLLVLGDVNIIDADRPVPAVHRAIVIRDGYIADILPATGTFPDSAVVINLKGCYVLPGFIDSHVHLATDPDGTDNRAHTLEVLQKMLYSGITTVRDMAGDGRTLAGLARDAALGEIISPNIYYSALMAGATFFTDPRTQASTRGGINGDMPYMKAVTDSTNLALAIAEAKGSGASGIKLYANLNAPIAANIAHEAAAQHIPVWAHAWLQGAKPSDLVNAGVISISHAPLLVYEKFTKIPEAWKKPGLPKGFWKSSLPSLDELFSDMKLHGTVLDATLLTYKKWAASDTTMQWDYEVAKHITSLAYAAGVTICAGTDDDQEDFVQSEMQLLVKDAGFSPFDAIVAATRNSAAAIHLASVKGSVLPGMDADLLILQTNPLDNIDNIKTVKMVVKGGRIYQP